MSDITRCPNCLSLVYDNAKTCHHCEESLGKKRRKIFTRGSVAFILFSVTVFGVCDAVNILDDLSDHRRTAQRVFETFVRRAMSGKSEPKREADSEELWDSASGAELRAAVAACSDMDEQNVQLSKPTFVKRGKRMLSNGRESHRRLRDTYTFYCHVWFNGKDGKRTSVGVRGTVVFSLYHRFQCRIVDWTWDEPPNTL